MRSALAITSVETHTEGMATRVVTSGLGSIPGSTMEERRRWMASSGERLRRLLMYEPRGHSAMSGAVLQAPSRPDADFGVVFIEVSGCLPMCGHGTMGVATALVETGMVEPVEPVTEVRLDTPAGLVIARVEVEAGHAKSVAITNVASYLHLRQQRLKVEGYGEVSVDLAWGGNFYAILPAKSLRLELEPARASELVQAGLAVMEAVNEQLEFHHPDNPQIDECRHVILTAEMNSPAQSRSAVAIYPGWLDRSPCGTGTSARMAQLVARGLLGVGDRFRHYSLLGTYFDGRVVGEARVGDFAAIIPEVQGRAWVTGMATWLLDPDDPFPAGFLLGEESGL